MKVFEHDPAHCHRTMVAATAAAMAKAG